MFYSNPRVEHDFEAGSANGKAVIRFDSVTTGISPGEQGTVEGSCLAQRGTRDGITEPIHVLNFDRHAKLHVEVCYYFAGGIDPPYATALANVTLFNRPKAETADSRIRIKVSVTCIQKIPG